MEGSLPRMVGDETWLSSMLTLTSLSIGKTAAYTLGNWPKLIRFVHDARIPLDNNATEHGIRGPVVGRRNHRLEVVPRHRGRRHAERLADVGNKVRSLPALPIQDGDSYMVDWAASTLGG